MGEEPFVLFDCSLARTATGRSCSDLRELLEAIRTMPDTVLEHHTMRCVLDDHFALYEFPNDWARWCWDALGDRVLAEHLGLLDPYRLDSLAAIRNALASVIEDHIWDMEHLTRCRPGHELHLIGSRLVAYDTGERLPSPTALSEQLPRLSLRSFYYHVHEARRRNANRSDDFSSWLEERGADPALVSRLRGIDFYFLNLNQLRDEIIDVFHQHQIETQAVLKVSA